MKADHPEAVCEQCGRENVVWFAPNEVWNAAGAAGILCPVCFVKKAEAAGLDAAAWKIEPEIRFSPAKMPVQACLMELRETLQRPLTPATVNVLEQRFRHLCALLENKAVRVPLETFAILDEQDRRVALTAFGSAVLSSAIRRTAEDANNRRRIIVPGSRDR